VPSVFFSFLVLVGVKPETPPHPQIRHWVWTRFDRNEFYFSLRFSAQLWRLFLRCRVWSRRASTNQSIVLRWFQSLLSIKREQISGVPRVRITRLYVDFQDTFRAFSHQICVLVNVFWKCLEGKDEDYKLKKCGNTKSYL